MKSLISIVLFCVATSCHGQQAASGMVGNPKFERKINSYLNRSVAVISVAEASKTSGITYLDAREKEEYDISHIPNALYIGYKRFDKKSLETIDKSQPIVVYCSIGYRSEKIGKKLKKMGYTNVKNLFGSIFEWANEGLPLEDSNGNNTMSVHTYNRKWSKWMTNSEYEKVY